MGYTIATEHFLRLFSYIITDKGNDRQSCRLSICRDKVIFLRNIKSHH